MKHYRVYTPKTKEEPAGDCCISESSGSRVEELFVSSMVQLILDIFSIQYGTHTTYLVGLLKSHLTEILIRGDESIIEQIENYTAQELLDSMKWNFKHFVDLKDDEINSEFRVHAKLSKVLKKISLEVEKLQNENIELKEKLNNKNKSKKQIEK